MKKDPLIAAQVKQILDLIKDIYPGKSVELRIPPYSAIQCVKGVVHRRGTPPSVVEMNPETLIKLVIQPELWKEFCDSWLISASGTNSNLSILFINIGKLMQNINWSSNGK
jgi:hypothetical protein